jgi:hypothetical protein
LFLPFAGSLPCARRPPITLGWRRLTSDGGNSLAALGAARCSCTNHTGMPGARHTSHAPGSPRGAETPRSSGGKPLPTRPPRGRSPLGRSLPSRVTARSSPPTGRGGLLRVGLLRSMWGVEKHRSGSGRVGVGCGLAGASWALVLGCGRSVRLCFGLRFGYRRCELFGECEVVVGFLDRS